MRLDLRSRLAMPRGTRGRPLHAAPLYAGAADARGPHSLWPLDLGHFGLDREFFLRAVLKESRIPTYPLFSSFFQYNISQNIILILWDFRKYIY